MVVRMRATRSHRDNRRAHLTLSEARFSKCPNCGKPVVCHRVCQTCGKYRGRQVLDIEARIAKKEKRRKEKEKTAR